MNSAITASETGAGVAVPADSKGSWYALAGSEILPSNAMLPILLIEQRLLLWRDSEARLHLWRDHCPHRGARLSLGRLHKDSITCRYHGLSFNGSGACVRIPAVPELVPPKSLCVDTFFVEERLGLIWGALGDPIDRYSLDGFGVAGRTEVVCRSFSCAASAEAVLAETLQFRFLPYGRIDGGRCSHTIQSRWPLVVEIACSDGAATQFAAVCIQPVTEQRSIAHLAVSLDVPKVDLPGVKSHFNRQFNRVRRQAENAASGGPG